MKSYLLLSIARIRIVDEYALPAPWRSWVDPRPPIVDPRTADDPDGGMGQLELGCVRDPSSENHVLFRQKNEF